MRPVNNIKRSHAAVMTALVISSTFFIDNIKAETVPFSEDDKYKKSNSIIINDFKLVPTEKVGEKQVNNINVIVTLPENIT
ncbi:hypothetical protein G7084_04130 [Weissella coleopterorum]|uniref:Uncharacterized protein n=1 Tax=Weissella coleopterorum TaxID=2714949 RepID=A0A6G8B028_9LACO|nr:hypothetical protein [Weissella coleopterorum]QIL50572.1 hypothetical protein G7084_04130 [Weissella coleopterorum]